MSRVSNPKDPLNLAAKQSYQAFLGFYNSNTRTCGFNNKESLVECANSYASYVGLTEVPALERKTIGKMGLKGVQGLVVER